MYTLARLGQNYSTIAEETGVPSSTVGFIVRAAREGRFTVKAGRGRKEKVTDEFIKKEFDQKAEVRGMTNAELAKHFGLSERQIRKRVNALGYHSHLRIRKPMSHAREC